MKNLCSKSNQSSKNKNWSANRTSGRYVHLFLFEHITDILNPLMIKMKMNISKKRIHVLLFRMKRGSKWWSKINRNYFKPVSESLFSNMKTLMSSDDVLDFSSEIPLLYTYYQ